MSNLASGGPYVRDTYGANSSSSNSSSSAASPYASESKSSYYDELRPTGTSATGITTGTTTSAASESKSLERGFGSKPITEKPVTLTLGDKFGLQGGSAAVHLGELNEQRVVIKIISFNSGDRVNDTATENDAINELNITHMLKENIGACSPNSDLICFLGYACNTNYENGKIQSEPLMRRSDIPNKTIWLVSRYIKYNDEKALGFDAIYKSYANDPATGWSDFYKVIHIFTNILRGIKKLHDLNIVHLDIKPENIMINEKGNPVIIDFGNSCSVSDKPELTYKCLSTFRRGTTEYAAPEIFAKNIQNFKKLDIYALGVILFEIFTRTTLFTDEGRRRKFSGIYSREDFVYPNKFYLFHLHKEISRDEPNVINKIKEVTEPKDLPKIDTNTIIELINNMLSNPRDRPASIDVVLERWKTAVGQIDRSKGTNQKLRIAFVRHAISCSNALRMRKEKLYDTTYPISGNFMVSLSEQIKDPPLSDKGVELAQQYGFKLHSDLIRAGFNPEITTFASSSLLRARQTVDYLFEQDRYLILPHLKEKGSAKENQPKSLASQATILMTKSGVVDKRRKIASASASEQTFEDIGSWKMFCNWLKGNLGDPDFKKDDYGNINLIIVGHGSYLREVYASLTGKSTQDIRMENMDCFIVESDISDPEEELQFKVIGDMIKAPPVTDVDILNNRCTAGGTRYTSFPIVEGSNIYPWKAQLDKLYVDYVSSLPLPSSIPIFNIVQAFGNSYTLFDDLADFNKDITVRTIFIKLYDCVKRMMQWPPDGYRGPPTYLIEGYNIETFKHYDNRILSAIGSATSNPPLSAEEVYNRLKDVAPSIQATAINGLLGTPNANQFPKSVLRTGEIEGNMILFNKDEGYDRFLGPINESASYSEFLLSSDRKTTTTEYQDLFYGSENIPSRLLKQFTDYKAQFFTIIDDSQQIDQIVQAQIPILSRKENKKSVIVFKSRINGEIGSIDTDDDNLTPPITYVKDTTYIKFNYTFERLYEHNLQVGIIQGFKLHEYPDIAAALFLDPPIEMSAHATSLFGAQWDTPEDSRRWILEKTGLTADEFRTKYASILSKFIDQRKRKNVRGQAISEVRRKTPGDTLYLNALELIATFSPRDACAKILDDSDDLSGRLKLALGPLISTGFLRNTCPSTEQLMSVIERERGRPKFEGLDFLAYIVALRDIATTKYIKSKTLYDAFRGWLISYNNTKRTRDTSLFIPAIIEIGDKLNNPEVSSTPITVGYWRKDFVKSLSTIVELLKGEGEGRLPSLLTQKDTTDAVLARVKRIPEEKDKIAELNKSLPLDPVAMNLPFNLDVVANLNEEDPKLAAEQVMNMNFQNKYVKKPNAAGLKVSDEIKRRTRKGFFKNTYPTKEEIRNILISIRNEYGLPPEHKQDITRIIKFAESKRSTPKMVFDKIQKYYKTTANVNMVSGFFGKSYPKKEKMIASLTALKGLLKVPVENSSSSGQNSSSSGQNSSTYVAPISQEEPDYEEDTGPYYHPSAYEVGEHYDDENEDVNNANNITLDKSWGGGWGRGGSKRGPVRKTLVKPPQFRKPGFFGFRGGNKKTAAPTRKMRRSQRRKQSGGGVTMPLGFYQDGAQMQGTYGSETGAGLGGMTSTMAREALVQTGGRQSGGSTFGSRRQKRRETRKAQRGGFSPSIMGSFAANGLSLLPVASYMTYRMTHNSKSKKGRTRKSGPVKTGRRRQTRR